MLCHAAYAVLTCVVLLGCAGRRGECSRARLDAGCTALLCADTDRQFVEGASTSNQVLATGVLLANVTSLMLAMNVSGIYCVGRLILTESGELNIYVCCPNGCLKALTTPYAPL